MLQVVIARDALQFLLNNLLHLLLDAPVICLHRFLHAVVAVCVSEIGNNGDFLVGTFLPFYLIGIHHNLAVENLLFDTLVEVVGHRTDKQAAACAAATATTPTPGPCAAEKSRSSRLNSW